MKNRELVSQKNTEIDALGVVVQLSFVDCKPGRLRKRPRQTGVVKKVLDVVVHTLGDRLLALRVRDSAVDFRQRLEDEARVKMIDKGTPAVHRVIPRPIR